MEQTTLYSSAAPGESVYENWNRNLRLGLRRGQLPSGGVHTPLSSLQKNNNRQLIVMDRHPISSIYSHTRKIPCNLTTARLPLCSLLEISAKGMGKPILISQHSHLLGTSHTWQLLCRRCVDVSPIIWYCFPPTWTNIPAAVTWCFTSQKQLLAAKNTFTKAACHSADNRPDPYTTRRWWDKEQVQTFLKRLCFCTQVKT